MGLEDITLSGANDDGHVQSSRNGSNLGAKRSLNAARVLALRERRRLHIVLGERHCLWLRARQQER